MDRRAAWMLWVLVLVGCANDASDPEMLPSSSSLHIQFGQHHHLATPDHNHVFVNVLEERSGGIWIFAVSRHRHKNESELAYCRYDGTKWSGFKPLGPNVWPPGQWAALTEEGVPLAVWTGDDGAYGAEPVTLARWAGEKFSTEETPWRSRIPMPQLCTDRQGQVHLVYKGSLSPSEHYRYNIVESEPGSKIFHSMLIENVWTPAEATTGRGAYSVFDPRLCVGLGDDIWLASVISPIDLLNQGKRYIGGQLWDGTKWSPLVRLTPSDKEASSLADTSVDMHGVLHVLWRQHAFAEKNGRTIGINKLCYNQYREGRIDVVKTISENCYYSQLVSDSEGRVYLAWLDKVAEKVQVQVWNGQQWSARAEVPQPVPSEFSLTSGSDCRMYIAWTDNDGFHLQEMKATAAKDDEDGSP